MIAGSASLLAYAGLVALMVSAINKPAPPDALSVPLMMLTVCILCITPWVVRLGLWVGKPRTRGPMDDSEL